MHTLEDIQARKAKLAQRIAAQRLTLAHQIDGVQPMFSLAHKGLNAARLLRENWGWISLGTGLVFALRRSRTAKRHASGASNAGRLTAMALAMLWLRRGMTAWRTWTWAREAVLTYRARKI